MRVYKMTDAEGKSLAGCRWGRDVEHTAPGKGDISGEGWLHAYTDPYLAVLLNPIYNRFSSPRLWEATAEVGGHHLGLILGCTRIKTISEVGLPSVTLAQRVAFGVVCTGHVYALEPMSFERHYHPGGEGWTTTWVECVLDCPGLWDVEETEGLYEHVEELLRSARRYPDVPEAARKSAKKAQANSKGATEAFEIDWLTPDTIPIEPEDKDAAEREYWEQRYIAARSAHDDAKWKAAAAAECSADAAILSNGLVELDAVEIARLVCGR